MGLFSEPVFESALRGDFRPLAQQRDDMEARMRLAADALLSMVSAREAPDIAEVKSAQAADALALLALRAWLAADLELLRTVSSALAELEAPVGRSAMAARWLALAEGRELPSPDLPAELARQGEASATIEATVQAALAALERNSLEEGVSTARRATRMARTEGLILMEYLSSLTLARARRHAGNAHLASRILGSLGIVAPELWSGWIRWERRLAGGSFEVAADDWSVLQELQRMHTAAQQGDAAQVESRSATTFPLVPMQRELDALRTAMDPDATPDELLADWALGRTDEIPGALAGVSVPDIDDEGAERASTFVVKGTAGPRRVLRVGAGLRGAAVVDEPYALAHARTFTALAVLVFAGDEGMSTNDLFRSTYGFDFRHLRDQGTLRTLVHRVRQRLPEGAELVRDSDRIRFQCDKSLAVPDPRCTLTTEARVLRFIARHGQGVSAKETSQALGLAVRTIQNSLRRLVEEGACQSIREGREIGYKIEDTTFNEPTLDRMKPVGVE